MEQILDLDYEMFDQCIQSMLRIQYHDKTEAAWTAMIAAQGKHDSMKDWVAGWEAALSGKDATQEGVRRDQARFFELMGSGF